jgi:hypothetical protein
MNRKTDWDAVFNRKSHDELTWRQPTNRGFLVKLPRDLGIFGP